MPVAARMRQAMEAGSWIRQMFELGIQLKRQHGEQNVFDLSLGNPILEPPAAFRAELKRLAEDPATGTHRYMPNAGYPETRQVIAAKLAKELRLPFTGQHVVMTCGAGGAINVVFKALLDPGDEVLVLAPYFPEYLGYADNHGGVARVVPFTEGFQPDLDALRKAITPRTKVLMVNSPNNPSGMVYSEECLRGIAGVLAGAETRFGHSVYLVSDEPYANLVYDGMALPRPLLHHQASILVTSYSKDLSLAGERIGYLAVHPSCPDVQELVDACTYANRVLGFVNAPALMQRVVRTLQEQRVDVAWYQRQRDRLYEGLRATGYMLHKPEGAFYAFPKSPIPDDVAFMKELLEERVIVTPGVGFGAPGYFRISYSVEERVLDGALEGFARVAKQHKLIP
ncbi:MAG: pyridoxal phosphate-dependent aminotransferase [Dehalococcoidia bacterium]|nr:pyridoxal phosphate-dependent aminotransferase [Dehalococcoidia bacterium]